MDSQRHQQQQQQDDPSQQQQDPDIRRVADEIAKVLEKTGVISRLKAFVTARFGGCFSPQKTL